MRRLIVKKFIQILLVICMFGATTAFAQSGAYVVKDKELSWWWLYDGEGLLSVHSSDIDFYCGEGALTDFFLSDWIAVTRPDGSVKYRTKGHYFTRVFYPMTPEVFFGDDSLEHYCEMVNNYDFMIAEGIAHHVFNDNSFYWGPLHKGRNTFGHTWSGTLMDLTGSCDSGMVDFIFLLKWQLEKNADIPACLPGCQILRKRKGPEVHCTE
jgi:hypothetical protein